MQTLFIPDIIHIVFNDKRGNSLRQENILVGIHTFATYKNNIDISPFLSDKNGKITITKHQVQQRIDNFISYGLMDYASVESAKPNIEIYFWGNDHLDRYILYWSSLLDDKKHRKQTIVDLATDKAVELDFSNLRKKEAQDLQVFSSCFNRTSKQRQDLILIEDIWDKPVSEKKYHVNLSL